MLAVEASKNFKQDLDYVLTAQRKYCMNMKTDLLSEFTRVPNHYLQWYSFCC